MTVGDTGKDVNRVFCGNCGSPLCSTTDLVPGIVMVAIGTLDDASWVEPPIESYTKDKIESAAIPADIIGFEGLMPLE